MPKIRARRALKNQENKGREYGRKTVPVKNPSKNALIAQDGFGGYDWSYQAKEEHPINYAFMELTSSRSSSSSDYEKNKAVFADKLNILNLEVKLRDNAIVEYTKKLKKAEKERDELKITLEKFQNSSKYLNNLLESQVNDNVKTRLGYKAASPAEETFMKSSEMLENQENVKSKSDKGYHAVPPPYTGNYIPPKPNRMLIDKHVESESLDVVSNVLSSAVKTVESKVESVDVKNKGVYRNYDDESEVEFKPVRKNNISHPTLRIGIMMMKNEYKEKGVIDSGYCRYMTGNKCYLTDYEDYDGGFVSFGDGKGRISRKGKIKTRTLDFDDVYFCKELKYNLFSVSQMCDKKNNVLFTDTECLVLSFNFKLLDESQVLLRVLRKDNIYSVDLKSVVPTGGIKREFSVARTPQQNGAIERKNKTLIEAARTMALVIKPHNMTPYELIRGRPPLINFMKPFGCHVTILNTKNYLGKFDEKADEGFFVGYFVVSKAMRVFNKRTRIVEETLKIRFLENASNVKGNRPGWLFDIDSLTISMNYVLVVVGFQTNNIAGTKDNIVAGQAEKKKEPEQEYILIPIDITNLLISQGPKDSAVDARKKTTKVDESQVSDNGRQDDQVTRSELEGILQQERQTEHINTTNSFNTVSSPINIAGPSFFNAASPSPINVAGTPANAMEEEVDINNVVSSYTIPDSDYARASLDRKSTTGVFHSKTNHIEIRHHFIRDSYEKKLIQLIKIHTDHNIVDLLTKAFDVSRTQSMTTLNEPLPQGTGSGSGPSSAIFWQWHYFFFGSGILLQAVGSSFWQWKLSNQQRECLDAINHLAVLESLQSCKSSKLDHLPYVKNSSLEACSRSLQGLDPSSEDSPSLLA
nr:hypothetical protein [Tanacetum cinerariifolium]